MKAHGRKTGFAVAVVLAAVAHAGCGVDSTGAGGSALSNEDLFIPEPEADAGATPEIELSIPEDAAPSTPEDAASSTPADVELSIPEDAAPSEGSEADVPAAPEPSIGTQGCTPGFWKNHFSAWQVYSPSQLLGALFPASGLYSLHGVTLGQAVSARGGSTLQAAVQILFRAAVPAMLNAAHSDVSYPRTERAITEAVDAALATGSRASILELAESLDRDNNLGCPL